MKKNSENAPLESVNSIVKKFEEINLSFMNTNGILIYFQVHSKYDSMKFYDAIYFLTERLETDSVMIKLICYLVFIAMIA